MSGLIGQQFGMLTVVGKAEPSPDGQVIWRCRCECGRETLVRGGNLRNGHTKSCGCYRERLRPGLHKTHGESKTRLYKIYHGMKKRCYNPNAQFYERYGGRGITICDEWLNSFEVFREWALANGYRDDLSIDRIDNDGNYEPRNCRWEASKRQRRNRRDVIEVEYRGQKMCLADAAKMAGIPYNTVRKRIKSSGWDVNRALSEPLRRKEVCQKN